MQKEIQTTSLIKKAMLILFIVGASFILMKATHGEGKAHLTTEVKIELSQKL